MTYIVIIIFCLVQHSNQMEQRYPFFLFLSLTFVFSLFFPIIKHHFKNLLLNIFCHQEHGKEKETDRKKKEKRNKASQCLRKTGTG